MILLEDVVVPDRLRVPALRIDGGGIIVVVGANGAGKSTLLDVLAGLLVPAQGRVLLDGQALRSLSSRSRAQKIASLAQEPPRFDDVTVAARIAHGLVPRRGENAGVDEAVVVPVARALGIEGLLRRRLGELSGGERRRAHVARALVDEEAAVVVLDEPFAGLDRAGAHVLVQALVARSSRSTIVVSVHDPAVALALGGRLLGLAAGAIVVDGALPGALSSASAVWGDVKVVVDRDYAGVLHRRA